MIGKTLGHYQITSQLGKGGMGEVFQAKDQKLGRDVAIKVLPEEFARDADRVARFHREAKLLASLNHPNIAAIHGLEEAEGTNFLVLELIEGETLAERLKRGPIPVEESLKLALQIAEALDAAHEKGIIHRDLKPSNIKVTPDGKVTVLDFGLAKAYAGDREEVNLSNSPTLSDAATQQGVILGTAAYMSPEQARGKAADKRADIWAFGCVLFEMLTGRAAFSGRDVTDILAAVIRAEPEWGSLPASLHWRLREVLERCLKKDAKDRYHDISDVKVDIQRILTDPSGVLVQPVMAVEPWRKLRTILPWAAATLILGLIIAGVVVWKLRPPEPRQVMRFEYELPEGQQLSGGSFANLAVSPDGKQFVYGTTNGLYLRSVDELTAKLIAGTEREIRQPFFSPNGKWIGYVSFNEMKLKKIAVTGSAPVVLCDVTTTGMRGPSWSADDAIVYGTTQGAVMRISANGGTPEPLVKAKLAYLGSPQILPDGKSILYTAGATQGNILVQSLKSGEPKELFAGTGARYLSTGHLVYRLPNNNNLFAIAFDLDRLEVVGGAVPVVEGVSQAAVCDAGTLVYIPGTASATVLPQRTLVWVDRNGNEEPIAALPNNYAQPKISPDGTRLALSAGSPRNIWVWDIVRKTLTRLTFEKAAAQQPIWTPDGKRIAYYSAYEAPNVGVYWRAADGTGESEKLVSATDGQLQLAPYSWSSDGKTLAMTEVFSSSRMDIGILSMEGVRTRKPLLQTEYIVSIPMISPDGRWMAYTSNEATGQTQTGDIYVRPFPDVNKGKWQASTGGGNCPLWSPDMRELFYLSDDNSVMAVPVETKPTLSFGTPKMLFKSKCLGKIWEENITGIPWDIAPDGKRFLMMKPSAPTAATPAAPAPRPKITIVLNWTEELKQRVPAK
jgi:Tol biopolymer transport system component